MMRNSPLDCPKKLACCYGFCQKIIRTRLDGAHGGRDIRVTSKKHDRQARAKFAQATLEFRTAQPWYSHIEKNTAWLTFAGQSIQQKLGRRISGDRVPGFLQTTFK